jgi:ABC-type Fe3+-hydroxamate transport system substrate-binding protein
MKNFSFLFSAALLAACTSTPVQPANHPAADTTSYAYTATYSSDITVPGDPANAKLVLSIWKMFETAKIQEMRPFFADSVRYDDAHGMHFNGPTDQLLGYAKSDIDGLDSMRFDILMWQNAHVNDRNEDIVSIWSHERRYPKDHAAKADTVLMQENWKVKNGKVYAFDQYVAKQ